MISSRPWCAGLLSLMYASVAVAANDVWDGGGANPPSGPWSTPSNWLDNTVPTSSDTATFNLPGTYTVSFLVNPAAIQGLTVSTGNVALAKVGAGVITLASGGQDVTVTGGSTLTLGSS